LGRSFGLFPAIFSTQLSTFWLPIAVKTVWLQSQSNHGGRKKMQMATNQTKSSQEKQNAPT